MDTLCEIIEIPTKINNMNIIKMTSKIKSISHLVPLWPELDSQIAMNLDVKNTFFCAVGGQSAIEYPSDSVKRLPYCGRCLLQWLPVFLRSYTLT